MRPALQLIIGGNELEERTKESDAQFERDLVEAARLLRHLREKHGLIKPLRAVPV